MGSSRDFLRRAYSTYCPTVRQRTTSSSHSWKSALLNLDPFPPAFKQRRGTYFYYNRAAISLACAQSTVMRIVVAPHKRPGRKPLYTFPTPTSSTSLHTPSSAISTTRRFSEVYYMYNIRFSEVYYMYNIDGEIDSAPRLSRALGFGHLTFYE